jgi:hypothetical protein
MVDYYPKRKTIYFHSKKRNILWEAKIPVVMKRGVFKNVWLLAALFAVTIAFSIFSIGCAASAGGATPTPYRPPDQENAKLDSQLNQLVTAQAQGEAAAFAERNGIELASGRVTVVIEYWAGQFEAASKAAEDAGADVEASYANLLQVSAPIDALIIIAESDSVLFIRLPERPSPAG